MASNVLYDLLLPREYLCIQTSERDAVCVYEERGWLRPQAVPCKLLGVAAVPTCVAMLENGAGRKKDQ